MFVTLPFCLPGMAGKSSLQNASVTPDRGTRQFELQGLRAKTGAESKAYNSISEITITFFVLITTGFLNFQLLYWCLLFANYASRLVSSLDIRIQI